MTASELARAFERGDGPLRGLFLHAWDVARAAGDRGRFLALLDAEAWTDAALMLSPRGWEGALAFFEDGRGSAHLRYAAPDLSAARSVMPTKRGAPAVALAIAFLYAADPEDAP